jgi:cell division protein FtsI (penicillin-binding protein 3)
LNIIVAPPAERRRPGGGRQALVAVAHVRLVMLAALFGAVMLAIVAKLAFMGVSAAPAAPIDPNRGLLPPRGDIVDRNGQPLARTIDGWSIVIHPHQVIHKDKAAFAAQLASLFPERTEAQYFALLNSDAKFAWLKRRAAPDLVRAANALGDPGIELKREPDRLYPQSGMAAHALGYLDVGGHGAYGMEKVLDTRLTADATRGDPVPLSIDVRVQAAMENELGTRMTQLQALGAAGVVLDVQTGEVIAMVSLPNFNPNAISGPIRPNNVTQSVYELGSTFKPITVAAAIDTGTITSMSRRFDATQPMRISGFPIRDDPGDEQYRWLNIPETLVYSSNIATARIVEELGAAKMQAMFRKLHFDQPAKIEIGTGRTLWPADWGRLNTITTGYGHGIAVTPMHLASAYAALVNGGIWRPATLLKVAPGKAVQGERVISEATSARMRQLLRLIVLRGTGKNGEAPGYRVGGKTGTAEAAAGGGYDKHRNVSTFAAAFPMDAPRYVVLAMLDSPKPNAAIGVYRTTAGQAAAPIVSRVIARTGAMLGVVPDAGRDIDVSELDALIWSGPKGTPKPVPPKAKAGAGQ